MDSYYPILDDQGNLFALSLVKTPDSLDIKFPSDYLERLGIPLTEGGYIRVHNPYVHYRYDPDKKQFLKITNLETFKDRMVSTKRVECSNSILDGFYVLFEDGSERYYDCTLEDQLGIMQALILAEEEGQAEIKCEVGGEPSNFLLHSLEECEKVAVAMAKHVLENRKKYDEQKRKIRAAQTEGDLGGI